jgi:predicted nucleic acid-binding protein
MVMVESALYVFDASPLVAGCQFHVAGESVASKAIASVEAQIPSAVYEEVVTRGGTRPDAVEAARLVQEGVIHLVELTPGEDEFDGLQYYQLGQGEREAMTLTARLASRAVLVTDDFLALIVANRLGLASQLFLDFLIGRARRGELSVALVQQLVEAVGIRYPRGFIPHSLALLGSLTA